MWGKTLESPRHASGAGPPQWPTPPARPTSCPHAAGFPCTTAPVLDASRTKTGIFSSYLNVIDATAPSRSFPAGMLEKWRRAHRKQSLISSACGCPSRQRRTATRSPPPDGTAPTKARGLLRLNARVRADFITNGLRCNCQSAPSPSRKPPLCSIAPRRGRSPNGRRDVHRAAGPMCRSQTAGNRPGCSRLSSPYESAFTTGGSAHHHRRRLDACNSSFLQEAALAAGVLERIGHWPSMVRDAQESLLHPFGYSKPKGSFTEPRSILNAACAVVLARARFWSPPSPNVSVALRRPKSRSGITTCRSRGKKTAKAIGPIYPPSRSMSPTLACGSSTPLTRR